MLYLAGNPDSPVLGYTKMAFHDGKVCIVQLTRIVEIVRIKGGTGDTGQIGGDTDCIRKMVTNNIASGRLAPQQRSESR